MTLPIISGTLEYEKLQIIQGNLEKIELGLNEAQVMISLHTHVNTIEAEKQKLRAQVLCSVLALSF